MIEKNIRGGISSVMGNRYVCSDENKNILYIDANNLYGYAMSQPLPYDEIKFDSNFKLEVIINTPDDSDIGFFLEVIINYPDKVTKRTFHFHPKIKL